jgi:hypothetical protein
MAHSQRDDSDYATSTSSAPRRAITTTPPAIKPRKALGPLSHNQCSGNFRLTTAISPKTEKSRPSTHRNITLKSISPSPGPDQIPATQPDQIQLLWAEVRALKKEEMPPKQLTPDRGGLLHGRGRGRGGSLEHRPRGETLSSPSSIASEDRPSQSTASRTQRTKSTAVTQRAPAAPTPRDPSFRHLVLQPRGINIDARARSVPGPYKYFGVHEGQEEVDYRSIPGLEGVSIWLNTGDGFVDRVKTEYSCMTQLNLCEAEFASFAKEHLMKREPRLMGEFPEDRRWRTERMLELVAKPEEGSLWESPPLVIYDELEDSGSKSYSFDLRPDVSYWLSLQAFNPSYVAQAKEYARVINKSITCPYFTVEFKRDDNERTAAENQVAAAGALALYNRYQLKRTRVRRRSSPRWSSRDLTFLKHYTLTFTGANYTFWCLEPAIDLANDGQWGGCTMTRIFQSEADLKEGVRSLIAWLNEIHCWGLREYGPACEADIKKCLGDAGFRVSFVAEETMIAEDSE